MIPAFLMSRNKGCGETDRNNLVFWCDLSFSVTLPHVRNVFEAKKLVL